MSEPGLPLPHHVAVLVQHEPGVAEEVGGAAAQVDALRARGRDARAVQAREPGVLDHPHVRRSARAEQPLEGAR